MAEKVKIEITIAQKELHGLVQSKELNAVDLLRLAYASEFTNANLGRTTSTDDKTKKTDQSADGTKKTDQSADGTKKTDQSADGSKKTDQSADDTTKKTDQSANKNYLEKIGKIKDKYPIMTSADFYQLAGVVAIKALQGPDIDFVPGRTGLTIPPDESCLPDLKLGPSELKNAFRKVKITNINHIVALYGGLKLATGGYKSERFDNSYFASLDRTADKTNLSPTDKALLEDSDFGNCIKCYATNKDDFIKNYKEAHKKLSEYDLPPAIPRSIEGGLRRMLAAPRAVGVVVAAAVVILSVFYVINRRRAKHMSQQLH